MADQTLGRYELLTPIGRGGMAIVWAARLRGTHGFSKIVALKTMLPALSSDPRFEKMFLGEAAIAARIEHPNVCEILDLGEDRGIVYLVMEWIDGEPLSRLLSLSLAAGRAIPAGIVARIGAQAARGLHAAHAQKTDTGEPCAVIHRDVSPQNILVTCDGLVKIVDFGVARAAERSDHTTATGFIKGKVAYLAPEQIESREIDVRVDVFALGVVLHELLGGEHPFRGETDLATLLAIASPDPAPALPDTDACPAPLRAIIARALEKDANKRYASMKELAAALEAFAADADAEQDAVAAFVAGVLDERREKRGRELRAAAKAADMRRDRSAAGASTTARATTAAPETARRGTPLGYVAVALAGIAIGALGLRAWQLGNGAKDAPAATGAASAMAVTASAAVASVSPITNPSTSTSTVASPSPSTTSTNVNAAAAPSATVAMRSSRAAAPAARPATAPTAPTASAAAPPKKNPLDGWD
ncbi:MAG: Protein kinase [Labilithrix sp.]|nr:Protein kinase [Labilithrix sp.]